MIVKNIRSWTDRAEFLYVQNRTVPETRLIKPTETDNCACGRVQKRVETAQMNPCCTLVSIYKKLGWDVIGSAE